MRETRVKKMASLVAGIVSIACCAAHAGERAGKAAEPPPDRETIRAWYVEAQMGDPEKQERIAALYLAPGARVTRAKRAEAAGLLLQAATSGRRQAMLQLADALDKGAHGYRKLPEAARCWSGAPKGFEERLACLRLTDFRDPAARVDCGFLGGMRADLPPATRNAAATQVRVCMANKTPTLLVPGPPPGKEAMERYRAYARHGVRLQTTGDVYDEASEKYRIEFDTAMVAAIDAERGKGYMEKLSREVEAHMKAWRERNK